jgi:hypothetical protein
MNGVKEDGELGEGCPLSMYGVDTGEAQGFKSGGGGVGNGDGGHGFEASPNEVIIDREFDESNLEIFETEVVV